MNNLRKELDNLIAMTEPGQAGCIIMALQIIEWKKSVAEQFQRYRHVCGYIRDGPDSYSLEQNLSILDFRGLFAQAFTNISRSSHAKRLGGLSLVAHPGKCSGDLLYCVAYAYTRAGSRWIVSLWNLTVAVGETY